MSEENKEFVGFALHVSENDDGLSLLRLLNMLTKIRNFAQVETKRKKEKKNSNKKGTKRVKK